VEARDTPPRSAASRGISQLVGVEFCRFAGGAVSSGLGRQPAQSVRRGRELARPEFVVSKLIEKPSGDAVLFLCR
jgi:hypothetical protein